MWVSLKRPDVVQAYLNETRYEPPLARQVLARLLGDLHRREELPDRVYAVTSMGKLSLTMSPIAVSGKSMPTSMWGPPGRGAAST